MPRATFTIPGKPFAWRRPRFNRTTGATFNDGKQEGYYSAVAEIARPHFPAPMEGPVGLTIMATFAMPKSWSKKKREAMFGRPHTQKPDLSNVRKAVEDALNRIAYADDSQVAACTDTKVWGLQDGTSIIVEGI